MSWFSDNDKKVYPTKMFVNYLPEVSKKEENIQTKSIGRSVITAALGSQGVAIDMILNVAPKLIDQGMELMGKTLNALAEDKAFPTKIRRNLDVINPAKISLPSKITLVRGNFANNTNKKGILFGDGEKMTRNQVLLVGEKELHIEIDIIQSEDKSAIYFQPTSYFYAGKSSQGHSINEIVLSFSFLPAGQIMVDPTKDLTSFLHFEALRPNQIHNFKSISGYDTSFQSSWITAPLDDVAPYTLVVQIQEIREGNSLAKLLQTVYVENESYIKTNITDKVMPLKESPDEK